MNSQKIGILSLAILAFMMGRVAVAQDQAMHIASGGNVGIGTDVPGEAVDVVRSEAASRFQLTFLQ